MVFNCHKCRRGWVIYNCIGPSALHSCAASLKDCLGPGWGLGAVKELHSRAPKRIIEIQEPNWVCHLIFPPLLPKKTTPTVTLLYQPRGEATFLSGSCRRGESVFKKFTGGKCAAFIQDRQDPNVSPGHQKDTAVLTLPGCHTLFLIFKDSWLWQIPLPLHLSTLSAASPRKKKKKLFYFLCHCLNFLSPISLFTSSLSGSELLLPLTTSSASKLSLLAFLLVELGCSVVRWRDAN